MVGLHRFPPRRSPSPARPRGVHRPDRHFRKREHASWDPPRLRPTFGALPRAGGGPATSRVVRDLFPAWSSPHRSPPPCASRRARGPIDRHQPCCPRLPRLRTGGHGDQAYCSLVPDMGFAAFGPSTTSIRTSRIPVDRGPPPQRGAPFEGLILAGSRSASLRPLPSCRSVRTGTRPMGDRAAARPLQHE